MSREDTAASFPSSLVNGSGTVYTSNIVVYYYYLRNSQGDVTGIVNASGTRVVTYTYDAWGNPLSMTGSMAGTLGTLNPLRYRGYVYDTETGLYYLQSRYYDPEICRFINADSGLYSNMFGPDLFSYCDNNPVNMIDNIGCRPVAITGADFKTSSKRIASSSPSAKTYRDVTEEVYNALREERLIYRNKTLINTVSVVFTGVSLYPKLQDFYNLVNHHAKWDIKEEECWEETISPNAPSKTEIVIFCGAEVTTEMIGNYTYGYLGHMYGFPIAVLLLGSYYAADFPTGDSFLHEMTDWTSIILGYNSYA